MQIANIHKKNTLIRKSRHRSTSCQADREDKFRQNLKNLFDIAHEDCVNLITNEEDKAFLLAQREPGRWGKMGAVDRALAATEARVARRRQEEVQRLDRAQGTSTSSAVVELGSSSSSRRSPTVSAAEDP